MGSTEQHLFPAHEIGWAYWTDDEKKPAPPKGRRFPPPEVNAASPAGRTRVKRIQKKSVDNLVCPLDGYFGCRERFCSSLCSFSSK